MTELSASVEQGVRERFDAAMNEGARKGLIIAEATGIAMTAATAMYPDVMRGEGDVRVWGDTVDMLTGALVPIIEEKRG